MAPVAVVLAAVTDILSKIPSLLVPVETVLETVPAAAVVTAVADVLALVTNVLPAIPPVFAMVAPVLTPVEKVLEAVPVRRVVGDGLGDRGGDGEQAERGAQRYGSKESHVRSPGSGCRNSILLSTGRAGRTLSGTTPAPGVESGRVATSNAEAG
jgi:hypothetical protein